jgi:hypothetical protein
VALMPTPQQRLDIDRVLRTIDAPKAITILIAEDNTPELAAKGMDDDREIFWYLAQVAQRMAEELFADMPQAQQRLQIMLPTREDARRLGILKR